jgi:ADP-ribose pyrophosphatase
VRYRGPLFSVVTDRIRRGPLALRRDLVLHPGAAAILPLLDDGRVLLVRQYRHAAGQWLWEIPAGTLEPGETPERCARRELREETGYEASRWSSQRLILPTPGYSSERIFLFTAGGLRRGAAVDPDGEIEGLRALDEAALREMLGSGELHDAKTLVALAMSGRLRWAPTHPSPAEPR